MNSKHKLNTFLLLLKLLSSNEIIFLTKSSRQVTSNLPPKKFLGIFGKGFQKRLKWVAMQSIVLLLNFIQVEYSRRIQIRQANKRHAEVPPFPLL